MALAREARLQKKILLEKSKKSISALNTMLERPSKTAPYKTLHKKNSHTKWEMSDFQYCVFLTPSKYTCLCTQNTPAYVHTVLWEGAFITRNRNSHVSGYEGVSGCSGCCQMKELFRSSTQAPPRQPWKCGWKWRQWLKADCLQTSCSILCFASSLLTVGWNRLKICKQFTGTVLGIDRFSYTQHTLCWTILLTCERTWQAEHHLFPWLIHS